MKITDTEMVDSVAVWLAMNSRRITLDDAREIIRLSIDKQGKTINQIIEWWDTCGTTWDEQEIIDYVSEGHDVKLTMDEILSWGTVFRLTSGLIVSWDY